MTAIEDFIGALYGAGWPSAAAFTRSFSRGDLVGITKATMPLAVEYIDATVEEWWLWAGTLDFNRAQEIARASPQPMWTPLAVEPATRGAVGPLDYFLEYIAERAETLTQEGQQFFPILSDQDNALYAVRRPSPTEPWRLWHLDREDFYWRTPTPGRERDGEAPLFEDWLARLTQGLLSGVMHIDEYGGVALANQPSEPEDPANWYPWGDW